jgi:hypothetical protein
MEYKLQILCTNQARDSAQLYGIRPELFTVLNNSIVFALFHIILRFAKCVICGSWVRTERRFDALCAL